MPEGEGIEFWIDEPHARWYEQAKDAPAGGSWTVNRLAREGVLASIQEHLANGHQVRLVLSTIAAVMAGLSDRAARSTTLIEFQSVLNDAEAPGFANVAAVWDTDLETTWRYLRQVHVEHIPSDALPGSCGGSNTSNPHPAARQAITR